MIPTLNLHIAAGHNTKIEETTGMENVEYLSAKNQEELNKNLKKFIGKAEKPVVLEVFTDANTDAQILKDFWIKNLNEKIYKKIIRKILPKKYITKLKKILKRG